MTDLYAIFPKEKFDDAKKLLITVKPWWNRYLERFEPVPINVPNYDDSKDWSARISISEGTLTMYVDIRYIIEADLSHIAGSIEHELQRSRRHFAERGEKIPVEAQGEYWNIATRMEVASALHGEYESSRLSDSYSFIDFLSSKSTFGPSLVDKYDVESAPVADATWMPEDLDLDPNLSAEEYAVEIARRAGAFDKNNNEEEQESEEDSLDSDDQNESSDSEESGGGSSEGSSSGDEEQSKESESDDSISDALDDLLSDLDEDSSTNDQASQNDSHSDEDASSESESDSDDTDSENGSDSDSSELGSSDDSGDEDSDESDSGSSGGSYEQLNTDGEEGEGRSGGWQGKESTDQSERESTSSSAIGKEDEEDGAATSTGIEESNQIASSDGRTDRASSGTEGFVSESDDAANFVEELEQMKQENPALEWDANNYQPEIYDPDYSSEMDSIEKAELELEKQERKDADKELIEDISIASISRSFDPNSSMKPGSDDLALNEEELKRRGIHWTDLMESNIAYSLNSAIQKGSDDYSYSVRNPNQGLTGPILMGSISYSPTVYVVFDTSGSMRSYFDNEKEILNDLFTSIRESYDARVVWFAASTQVYAVGETKTFDDEVMNAFNINLGSTSFGKDLASIIDGSFSFNGEEYDQPDVMVVISDMEFQWSGSGLDNEPDIDIIRVIPKSSLLTKVRQRRQEMFHIPDWIFSEDGLVEMI